MRNLDGCNPDLAKPSRFARMGAIIPLVLGSVSATLAIGAAPGIPFQQNPAFLLSATVVMAALGMAFLSLVCKWGWQAKWFGASLLNVGSLSLLFFVPCLCLLMYSKQPAYVGTILLAAAIAAHVWWCSRFLRLYRHILHDNGAAALLYQEEPDAVYYMQSVDKHLLDKRFRFQQIPRQRYFVLCLVLAFMLVPAIGAITALIGLPFVHIFLLVGSLPMSLMAAGLCTRAWLVFIHYPALIRRRTSKRVYVDLSSGAVSRSASRYE